MSSQSKKHKLIGAVLAAAKIAYRRHVAACRKLGVAPDHFDEWAQDFTRDTPEQLASEPIGEYQPHQRYHQYTPPKEKI